MPRTSAPTTVQSVERAFTILREQSQHENIKLREVARTLLSEHRPADG